MRIRDKMTLVIEVIDGVREEDRSPYRWVTLDRDDLPGLLPDVMESRSGKLFRPEFVAIDYMVHGTIEDGDEDKMSFRELRIGGPVITKSGKPGKSSAYDSHIFRRKDMDEDRLDRLGGEFSRYIVPADLDGLIDKFDPYGEDHPFAAE